MYILENSMSDGIDSIGATAVTAWSLFPGPIVAVFIFGLVLACAALLKSRSRGLRGWTAEVQNRKKGTLSDLGAEGVNFEPRLKFDSNVLPEYRGILWNTQSLDALNWLKGQTRRI
jgi:hypothetical protein